MKDVRRTFKVMARKGWVVNGGIAVGVAGLTYLFFWLALRGLDTSVFSTTEVALLIRIPLIIAILTVPVVFIVLQYKKY